jgi:AraC family transcriptional regulator
MIEKNNYYRLSIEAALEYLENNIDSDLSIQTLSNVAGFSPYHFHRVFRAITGKTLHQYILSRKLHLAANRLLYECCDITQIALDLGFSTPSAFSRNFKEQFGCTPKQYREEKERKYPVKFAKISFPEHIYDENKEQFFSQITLPNLQTLCIGVTGLSESWESPEINKAYSEIFNWIREHDLWKSTRICGITMDSPEVKSLSDCRYYACATVKGYIHSESLVFRSFQTSGTYICCKMNRTQKDFANEFFKQMEYFYGFYLPHHQLMPDFRPFVEFYEPDNIGNLNILFCVPVKKARNGQ